MHQYNCQDPEVKREEGNNSIVMLSKSKRHLHQRNDQKRQERCRNIMCDGKTHQANSAVYRRIDPDPVYISSTDLLTSKILRALLNFYSSLFLILIVLFYNPIEK